MNKSISEKILYTLDGCPACLKIKEKLKQEIEKGKIELRECKPKSKNEKDLRNCIEAFNQKDFDGFPSIYDKKGKKVF